MIENRLTYLNTNYQKTVGKLWTYTYANNYKAQIDYVFINKKWGKKAMDCEAYSFFDGVLRSPGSQSKNTTKPMKKRHTNSDQ